LFFHGTSLSTHIASHRTSTMRGSVKKHDAASSPTKTRMEKRDKTKKTRSHDCTSVLPVKSSNRNGPDITSMSLGGQQSNKKHSIFSRRRSCSNLLEEERRLVGNSVAHRGLTNYFSAKPPPRPPAETPNSTYKLFNSGPFSEANASTKTKRRIERSFVAKVHPVVEALMIAMTKNHMLDVTLRGKEGVEVKTSRYVLACRNEALEELLFKDDPPATFVAIGEYSQDTILALVEYCFTGELTKSPLSKLTADAARGLVELAELAHGYHFQVLYDEVYQMARTLMNRYPAFACAIFNKATGANVKEFAEYALQTIELCPEKALLGEESGIQHLCPERVEIILSNHEMDVDEMSVFRMLSRWFECRENADEGMEVAKRLSAKIDLTRIETRDLQTSIKQSDFFDQNIVDKVITQQSIRASNGTLSFSSLSRKQQHSEDCSQERVLVSGAGDSGVNGLYYRESECNEEAENQEDSIIHFSKDRDSSGAFGLYLWGDVWGIALEVDLSNTYYQCQRTSGNQVPEVGWTTGIQGESPPPTCTWISAGSSHELFSSASQFSSN